LLAPEGRVTILRLQLRERRFPVSEENKAALQRFYEEVLNKHNLALIDELAAPNFVDHNPSPGQTPGREGLKDSFRQMLAAFPDLRVTVDDLLAEADKVAAHITMKGTHKGEFMGIAPTGRQVEMRISDIVRIAGGKAVERWGVEDSLGMLTQLGVVTPPA